MLDHRTFLSYTARIIFPPHYLSIDLYIYPIVITVSNIAVTVTNIYMMMIMIGSVS